MKKMTRELFSEIENEYDAIIANQYDDDAPVSIHARLYLALEAAGITVVSREQALNDAKRIVSKGWPQ